MKDIVFTAVSKSFGDNRVLDNFSCVFPAGGRIAVMGPSGAGKTTLINLIMGLTGPDSGSILGNGNERFSCVFQEDRLIEGASAVENIAPIFRRKISEAAILDELNEVGITASEAGERVSGFSGGMKRRVAIVRAMMADSDTVILDEPFKGLDEELKERVMGYVEDRLGTRRLIMITHDSAEAEMLCDEKLTLLWENNR